MGRVLVAVALSGLLVALVVYALGVAGLGDPEGWDADGGR